VRARTTTDSATDNVRALYRAINFVANSIAAPRSRPSRRGDEHDVSRQSVFTPSSIALPTHRGQIHHRISGRYCPKPSKPASAAIGGALQPYCSTIDFVAPAAINGF